MRTTTSSAPKRAAAIGTAAVLTAGLTLAVAAPAVAAPVVPMPDSYSTPAGTPLVVPAASGVLANDIDPDGGSLGVTGYGTPSHGSLTLDQNTGAFTYTPAAGFTGSDTFDYYVTDYADSVTLGPVAVTITVVGQEPPATQPPVAVPDAYTVTNTAPYLIAAPGFMANDADPDSPFFISNWTNPSHGDINWDPSGQGGITYTADAGYVGLDTMQYRLGDGDGNLSDWTTVTFDVQQGAPVNTPPVAQPDAFTTTKDQSVTLPAATILANDTDADGDTLSVWPITEPVGGWLPGESVSVVLGPDMVYFPPTGFTGTRVLRYQAYDGTALSLPWTDIVITITEAPVVNEPPVAVDDAYAVVGDQPLTGASLDILANDSDPEGDPLKVVDLEVPAGGQLPGESFSTPGNGSGEFSYTPPVGFVGERVYSYRATDGESTSDVATITFTIGEPVAGNLAPEGKPDVFTTPQDTPLTVGVPGVLANDWDAEGDAMLVHATWGPDHGTVAGSSSGAFVYTPPAGFVGTATFSYQVRDADTLNYELTTVTIQVLPAGQDVHAPSATGEAFTTAPGTPLVVPAAQGVLANDTDLDGDALTVDWYGTPASGDFDGAADGSFVFTPAAGFTGTVTVPYTATDGTFSSAPALITITVEAPRDEEPGGDDPSEEPGGDPLPEFPPSKPEDPARPAGDDGDPADALATTGVDGIPALGGLAGLLLALGLAVRRMSRRAS